MSGFDSFCLSRKEIDSELMSPLHFSAKARLYGHIFYHKCCARVSRSGLLLPSVKSKLLIVKYRAIENVLVTRYDGMRKCGCSKFED